MSTIIVTCNIAKCSTSWHLLQVLGFVGAPFTLSSYIVEGGSSKNFAHVKRMAFSNPEVLHALNSKLADSVADYVRYQVRTGSAVSLWHMPCRCKARVVENGPLKGARRTTH